MITHPRQSFDLSSDRKMVRLPARLALTMTGFLLYRWFEVLRGDLEP